MSAKVWLVDDDISVRESLSFLLKAMDYDVKDFASLSELDAVAAEHLPLSGCLLLGIELSDSYQADRLAMHGIHHPLLPVIIMTTDDFRDDRQLALYQNMFAVFHKPLDMEPLIDALRRAIDESKQRSARWDLQQNPPAFLASPYTH